jgi:flagellar L-ring protein precursor FlgH
VVAGHAAGGGGGKAAIFQNEFSGMITVTVMEVLLNGNMVVAGEKRLAVGAEEEIIRFGGIVNPNNLVEVSMVRDLVDQEVQYLRKTKLLAKEHFIQENIKNEF